MFMYVPVALKFFITSLIFFVFYSGLKGDLVWKFFRWLSYVRLCTRLLSDFPFLII